ncbi:MAG: septum formation initiator family protein [Ardenticatenaceae bacterium]|nr:septum formation initiator family protein [Anaerolineales bacterium]MCB8938975.1 septum formation initiator family protein [Ardenticatenaceae bacterium]MCB8974731.1 septum formation initiator family protein [Ardenticatenaceae bacterium]
MYKELWRQRPLLTLPQIIILVLVGTALFVAVDLNRRAQAGQLVGVGEGDLQAQVDAESTRQVSLQVTLEYVQSQDYVAAYARDEAGYLLPGEKRVVPLVIEATPLPTAVPTATPDPIQNARPWQAWWQLLVDAPKPSP